MALSTADDAANVLNEGIQINVERHILDFRQLPSHGTFGEYKRAAEPYFKVAGRVADLAAARGSYRPAYLHYRKLAESTLGKPLGLTVELTPLPKWSDRFWSAGAIHDRSIRTLVRFALRTVQLFRTVPDSAPGPIREIAQMLPVDRTLFSGEEIECLLGLAHRVLSRGSDGSDEFQSFPSPEIVLALEQAAMCRFNDLYGSNSQVDWYRAARLRLDGAREAAFLGHVSVLKRMRMLFEEARICWHGVVFRGHSSNETALVTNAGKLGGAVTILNHLAALAEVRDLPLQRVDALLLRAEIMGVCRAAAQEDDEACVAARRIVCPLVAKSVRLQHARYGDPQRDLNQARKIITQTGYRKRMVELTVLSTRRGGVRRGRI